MKIRLAKKIIKQNYCFIKKDLSFNKINLYWIIRWNRLYTQTWNIKQELKGKIDYRIIKAINLINKKKKKYDKSRAKN